MFELLDDPVHVAVLQLQNLVQPVDQLDVRIAPHLAEDGGRLDGPVRQAIELAEQVRRD